MALMCISMPPPRCHSRVLIHSLLQDLRAAAQNGKIQAALSTKVSRERVGAELSGMLAGKVNAILSIARSQKACLTLGRYSRLSY